MINLAIISDIRLYREGIGSLLGDIDEFNVAGILENKTELSDFMIKQAVDITIVDMRMQDCNEILSSIQKKSSDTKIIVIAIPPNDDSYLLCVETGITGYLSKESSIDELINAIITVDKGGLHCPCSITQYILESVRHKRSENKIADLETNYSTLLDLLTRREIQIIKMLAEGMSNKKIASALTIELSTVKNHVHNILVKTGVESRTQIACMMQKNIFAYKNSSLDLDPHLGLL